MGKYGIRSKGLATLIEEYLTDFPENLSSKETCILKAVKQKVLTNAPLTDEEFETLHLCIFDDIMKVLSSAGTWSVAPKRPLTVEEHEKRQIEKALLEHWQVDE